MWQVGSDLGIRPCRSHSLLGEPWIVIRMDQVMRRSGMIGVRCKPELQERRRFPLIVIRLVLRRGGCHQRQGKENGRFLIFWISLVNSFHRISLGFGADRVVLLLPAVVEC